MVNVGWDDIINLILNQIIYRFGISGSIITDQGTMLIGEKAVALMRNFNSSLYCAEVNG